MDTFKPTKSQIKKIDKALNQIEKLKSILFKYREGIIPSYKEHLKSNTMTTKWIELGSELIRDMMIFSLQYEMLSLQIHSIGDREEVLNLRTYREELDRKFYYTHTLYLGYGFHPDLKYGGDNSVITYHLSKRMQKIYESAIDFIDIPKKVNFVFPKKSPWSIYDFGPRKIIYDIISKLERGD